jgi:protein-tyrosine-phosphatase
MDKLPGSVLFACTSNVIRSPMAEAIMKYLFGRRIYVDSVGVIAGIPDPFVAEVMDEIGIDLVKHKPKTFDELEDSSFDLIVTLSPQAQHRAVEMTRAMACDIEFWNTMDPSIVEGSRETRLDAYRGVRDQMLKRVKTRFQPAGAPVV